MYSVYIRYTHAEVIGITIHLNQTSDVPLYEQIVRQVRRQVLEGALRDGDQLPSIRALARDLQVSIITTKRAYEELEREGLLAVSTGRGTFVRAGGIDASRRQQLDELAEQVAGAAEFARALGVGKEEFQVLAGEQYEKHGAGSAAKG